MAGIKKTITPKIAKKRVSAAKGENSSAPKKSAASGVAAGKKTPAPRKIAANLSANEVRVKKANDEKKDLSPREERIQNIKLHLLRQREVLLSGAESALNELPGQTIFPDLGDQASAETDRNFMLRLRGREQRLLKKIDEAVDRIDKGTFGICDDCGNEIDIKRLEVRPVTTMCIECKTLQEEEEKLREQ